jgi:hypothetical protein
MHRGIAGTIVAHLSFDLTPLAIGTTVRSGPSQCLAEAVATFTLVLAILGGLRYVPSAIPWLVGLTITAAYWFTALTSFANPGVTLARGFTTSFAGIAINHVPAFIVAQLIGAHNRRPPQPYRQSPQSTPATALSPEATALVRDKDRGRPGIETLAGWKVGARPILA